MKASLLLIAALALVSHACRTSQTACAQDSDCPAGWDCHDGDCRKRCVDDADCWPPVVVCSAGSCQPNAGRQCSRDTDCAGDATVDGCSPAGVCQCAAAGLPCRAPDRCLATGCQPPPSPPGTATPRPSVQVVVGGGRRESPQHRLDLVVPAGPVGQVESAHHRLRLGATWVPSGH